MNTQIEKTFQMILHAGDARSKALESIKMSEQYDFASAESLINEAKEEMRIAHKIQTEMMQDEINGSGEQFSILLVHGQDHFSMATVSIDLAETSLALYRKMQKMEEIL